MGFIPEMQGCFSIWNLTKEIYHINRIKQITLMMSPTDAKNREKNIWQDAATLHKLRIKGNFLNLINLISEKPAVNIIVNVKDWMLFPQDWKPDNNVLTISFYHCSRGPN